MKNLQQTNKHRLKIDLIYAKRLFSCVVRDIEQKGLNKKNNAQLIHAMERWIRTEKDIMFWNFHDLLNDN